MSAEDLYSEFHKAEATHEQDLSCVWPAHASALGPAGHIVYRTDKWGDGKHDYIHEFGPGTAVYACDPKGRTMAPPVEVAWLGALVELEIIGEDGIGYAFPQDAPRRDSRQGPGVFAYRPRGSLRARLVVIAAPGSRDPEALVIMGPRMDVQPRGVVG